MKRVDLLGPSGVGKSTIYLELLNNRTRRDQWITPKEAKIIIAKNYLGYSKKSVKSYLLNASLYMPFGDSIKTKISDYILSKHKTDLLWQKSEGDKVIFQVVLKGSAMEGREHLHSILGINWFLNVYRNVLLIENSLLKGLVLFDESLSQKVYGITLWQKGSFKKTVREYFNNIPLPVGLVHCQLDSAAIYERLKNREKVTTGQREFDQKKLMDCIEAQLEIAEIGSGILQERGVKVLDLNCDNDYAHNKDIIRNYIRSDLS